MEKKILGSFFAAVTFIVSSSLSGDAKAQFQKPVPNTVINHENLPEVKSWSLVVQEMRQLVQTAPVEWFKLGIFGKEKIVWTRSNPGNILSVKRNEDDVAKILKYFNIKPGSEFKYCKMHTHGKKSLSEVAKRLQESAYFLQINKIKRVSSSPSILDNRATKNNNLGKYLKELTGLFFNSYLDVVFDELGIWYSEKFSSKKQQNDFMQNLKYSQDNIDFINKKYESISDEITRFQIAWLEFVGANSLSVEELQKTPEYATLIYIYAKNEIALRYVSYIKTEEEKPCAGVFIK
jgi:hypothetical protein